MINYQAEPTVYILDDEEPIRRALKLLARAEGLRAKEFETAQEFLSKVDGLGPGCLLLDICMPDMSGLEVQKQLKAKGSEMPIIVITGHADVPTAVRAMKAGAYDFVEKPFNSDFLIERVQECLNSEVQQREDKEWRATARVRLERLTPREHEVMEGLVTGKRNKEIARELSISYRTVELHRAKVMEKLEAKTLSDVVRISLLTFEA